MCCKVLLAQAVWTGQRKDDVREGWTRQVWEATSWTKSRGPEGTFCCESRDLGITASSWQVFVISDNRMISTKDTCPEDIKKTPMRHMGKDARILGAVGRSVVRTNQSHVTERFITDGRRDMQAKKDLGPLAEH